MLDTVGERLKYARERVKLKQKEVCESVDIPKIQTLSAYERGVNSPPIEVLKRLSRLYHVSIDWIVCGEEFRETTKLGTADLIENLFNAANRLGLDIGPELNWDNEPTGEYVVWLKNDTLRGFNSLIGDLIRLHDLREMLDSDDYRTLVQKRIKACATESNNFELIPPEQPTPFVELADDDGDLPF